MRACLPPAWIGCVLGIGLVLSGTLFLTIRDWERREMAARAADLAKEQAEKLEITVLRSMEMLHSIASLHDAQGKIERNQFHEFVHQALNRQPELQALEWNPRVIGSERERFEATARASGFNDFHFTEQNAAGQLVPAQERPEYVPVYFIEPMAGNEPAQGFDLNSNPRRRACMETARDRGLPVATAPIRLAQGSDNRTGFLVLLPVYQGHTPATVAERREHLAGFAVAVFRVSDLVGSVFRDLRAKGLEARLYDESPAGEMIYGTASQAAPARQDWADSVVWVEAAGRRWAMTFAPSPEFLATESHLQSWVVLVAGIAFTLLTTAYLYSGWSRTRQIAAANAALQEEVVVRQRAEAAAAAANHAKSDFLASMSHEIRTPLNAILGYTQMMQRDRHLPEEQRDTISGISASGHHLLGLINEILDLSKIEAGRMELKPVDFDLVALGRNLATTFQSLCAQKRIGFRFEMHGPKPCPVRGDEGKLRQILINLLGNAVKFTNLGEVYLHIKLEAEGRWLFEVIDTGLGIPAEEHQDIFKPFHQGSGAQHQGGTGLGLAIAQKQVELLGGKLELQSERGIGSRFHFTLPLASASGVVEEAQREVARLAPSHHVRVLVVDDLRENREVLDAMLSAIGCEVLLAADGATALVQAEQCQPDIVLVDLLMPGLSGTQITRRLLAAPGCEQVKVIAHTASVLPQHHEEALAAGCLEVLTKPFSAERIYECLKQHLGVEFEYVEIRRESETLPPLAAGTVVVPDELCARLMVAAELHSATTLKACLQELRQLSPEARQLAEHIRQLMRSYDMDGILRLLSRVTTPGAPAHDSSTHHGSLNR